MEPDIEELLKRFQDANETLSKAFIKQSLAWNSLREAVIELREKQPTLFNQDKESA